MQKKEKQKYSSQYEKMTTAPIKGLIASLALPTIVSMLVTTVYNVTDTYFVSQINVQCSGATGIIFTLMAIIQAFGFMFGQGSGSIISRKLGAKDVENAKIYASTGATLAIGSGIIMLILGLIFLTPLMKLLGSTDTILPYAKRYGFYILLCAPSMCGACLLNNVLRYEGMASLAMVGLAGGSVLNIALDPLFIFVFNMGIDGAGLATCISQYASLLVLFSAFWLNKTQSKISFRYIRLKPAIIMDIVSTGLPSLARQGLNSISNMFLNQMAGMYGDTCIAAMSIVSKASMLIFSVGIGVGQGYQPFCGFNYGAKLFSRLKKGAIFTWELATAVIFVLSTVIGVFAPQVISLFREEEEIVSIGTIALRCICAAMVLLPTIFLSNMTFQVIGQKNKAFFLACVQSGLYFIPLILILPRIIGLTGIEISYAVSYTLASFTSFPFLLKFLKGIKEE